MLVVSLLSGGTLCESVKVWVLQYNELDISGKSASGAHFPGENVTKECTIGEACFEPILARGHFLVNDLTLPGE